MNVYTISPFFAGILSGLNKRSSPQFTPDPSAHYKLIGLSAIGGLVAGTNDYFKRIPPPTKLRYSPYFFGGTLGGLTAGGIAYCGGLLLTKISEKDSF